MRMFVSIKISENILPYIQRIQEELLQYAFKGKKTPLEMMHLTISFMERMDEKECNLFRDLLHSMIFPSLSLEFIGIGSFRSVHGNLYYIKVKESEELDYINDKVKEALTSLGIHFDKKQGLYHITILRNVILKNKYELITSPLPPNVEVISISLIESHLTQKGAIHIERDRFPLLGKTSTLI